MLISGILLSRIEIKDEIKNNKDNQKKRNDMLPEFNQLHTNLDVYDDNILNKEEPLLRGFSKSNDSNTTTTNYSTINQDIKNQQSQQQHFRLVFIP